VVYFGINRNGSMCFTVMTDVVLIDAGVSVLYNDVLANDALS